LSNGVALAFAAGRRSLNSAFVERVAGLSPGLPLLVVAENPPGQGQWIPWHASATLWQNLSLVRSAIRGLDVKVAAVQVDSNAVHPAMRWACALIAPGRVWVVNENLDYFALRPRSARTIWRHVRWRFSFHLWALRHPHSWRALLVGPMVAARKRLAVSVPDAIPVTGREAGVSVVIPSREGRRLLAKMLPGLLKDLVAVRSEVIISDNGSEDGTAGWLSTAFPTVRVLSSREPLAFAAAANAGIRGVRFDRVLLLNNDMEVAPGLVAALCSAFERIPDLFCATSEIHFPSGRSRHETGKAVMPLDPGEGDFPVICVEPVGGEGLSPVLYGSGGCSLFDAARLRALGGFDESYAPAYAEDLDLGVRAWQHGWPTVFVAGARVVHEHRATTSRFYSDVELRRLFETNYLRFLARVIRDPGLFRRLWHQATWRLVVLASIGDEAAEEVLATAGQAPSWTRRPAGRPAGDRAILALASGDVAVFPGRDPAGRPRVLIACPSLPIPPTEPDGVRMENLTRRAASDFDQILVCFADELRRPPDELLETFCEVVVVRRPAARLRQRSGRPAAVEEAASLAFQAALGETRRKWQPQLAQLESARMAQYVDACRPARVVLVEHEVASDVYGQLAARGRDSRTRAERRRWAVFEPVAWRRVDCVVMPSDREARLVAGAGRVVVLQDAVDLDYLRPGNGEPEPGRLLFLGPFSKRSNLVALEWFLRLVWPRLTPLAPRLHVIAGRDHRRYSDLSRLDLDLRAPGLEVEGSVQDLRPAYARAAVVVAPSAVAVGGNLEVMQAMAMGKAVVASPLALAGLDLSPDGDVLASATAAEMAEMIRGLLLDPARRRALGAAARRTAERRFPTWDAVASRQRELYLSLMAPSADPGPERYRRVAGA
jgi:GT2 family glycosyltransferase/glycosyltransferase involved in cell wall biosynthesis